MKTLSPSSDYEELTNEENDFTESSLKDDKSGTSSLPPAYDELANETMNNSDLGAPSPPPAYNKLT